MIELNLAATTDEEKLVKEHLQEMVSETLAEKINNGVYIEKDGKRLLNKKTLAGFVDYACEEAQKLVTSGKRKLAVEGSKIMSWCIHYFEEDDIIGTLYNEDGTEYKPVVKASAPTRPIMSVTPSKPAKAQLSLFDSLAEPTPEPEEPDTDDEEIDDEEPAPEPEKHYTPSPIYQSYMKLQAKYKDCLLFLRLGDFYEMLGENAKIAAKELDLTLTGRECGLESRVPMCGVPYHAIEQYISKLIQKGYKVALAERDTKGEETVNVKAPAPVIEVDEETGEILNDDSLTEEEMQCFDGDIIEPQELVDDNGDDFDLEAERALVKHFDSETVAILSELLDNEITIA